MNILCLAPVHGHKRKLLESSLAQFEAQTHANKFLAMFDDQGNITPAGGEQWSVMATQAAHPAKRATKYNLLLNMIHEWGYPFDAVAVWEPYAIYLPWHLAAISGALTRQRWAMPSMSLMLAAKGHTAQGSSPYGIAARRDHLVGVGGWPPVADSHLWGGLVGRLAGNPWTKAADPCQTHKPSVVVGRQTWRTTRPIENLKPVLCEPAKAIFQEFN